MPIDVELHVQRDTMKEPSSFVTNYISVCLSNWSFMCHEPYIHMLVDLELQSRLLTRFTLTPSAMPDGPPPAADMRSRIGCGTDIPGTSLWRNSALREETRGHRPMSTGTGRGNCMTSCRIRIATHCNALQHTARRCNTLQHIATHCKPA